MVQSSKLTVGVQPPLAVSQDQFALEPFGQSIKTFYIIVSVNVAFIKGEKRILTLVTQPLGDTRCGSFGLFPNSLVQPRKYLCFKWGLTLL